MGLLLRKEGRKDGKEKTLACAHFVFPPVSLSPPSGWLTREVTETGWESIPWPWFFLEGLPFCLGSKFCVGWPVWPLGRQVLTEVRGSLHAPPSLGMPTACLLGPSGILCATSKRYKQMAARTVFTNIPSSFSAHTQASLPLWTPVRRNTFKVI